jgi:lipopolysaccharide export system permease protein
MIKKIDLYILRKFLGTFFFSISLIIVIVIVFDISEKIEDFIEKDAPLSAIILDYYFNFIPYFVNLFSPLFTFIAVIFFTSRMASRAEIVAILSSGVSFYRMLYPYMLASVVIAAMSLYLNNFVIPNSNKKRIAFEERYIRNPYRNQDRHIHRQIATGTYIYMENYNNRDNIGENFSIDKLRDGKLYYKLMSDYIQWDSTSNKWQIHGYFIRYINGMNESIKTGMRLDTTFNFTPKDFGRKLVNIETMNYHELNRFIDDEKMKGAAGIEMYEIEKFSRIAFPFATFILTLIGVSLASRKVRGGIGLHIGLGLLISFSLILFMRITTVFAQSGLMHASLAVWIPNILFGCLAAYLLKKAPK